VEQFHPPDDLAKAQNCSTWNNFTLDAPSC
jgi:hypothetical protein